MRPGFRIGLFAGALAILAGFLGRILLGWVFLPELGAQTFYSIIPGWLESNLIQILGDAGKYTAVMGAVVINLLLYGVLGMLAEIIKERAWWKRVLNVLGISYGITLGIAVLLALFNQVYTAGMMPLVLYLLPSNILYSILLTWQARYRTAACPSPTHQPKIIHKRRLIIKSAAAGAVATVLLFYGLDALFKKPAQNTVGGGRVEASPSIFSNSILTPLIEGEVTPNDLFYRVDINFLTPTVDASTWRLKVHGFVGKDISLTYSDLLSLPSVEEYATLECVSNTVDGELISTAKWKGVRLRTILEMAELMEGAEYIVFRCRDGYDVGIPLDRGLMDACILAYEMNGEPLPPEHGFPVRAIVPGLYGMMNAKWVEEIEVKGKEYKGFWQRKGWTNKAEYKTRSMIVIPGDAPIRKRFRGLREGSTEILKDKTIIAGIAFAGDRGIRKVEVSVDGGRTWEQASIKDPLSDLTWVLWAAEWTPGQPGIHKLMVRAVDGEGRIQEARITPPFPEGATGYHVLEVRVIER